MSLWYLLFDGNSSDGRGEPKYAGRTTHKELAKNHFNKVDYHKNPYSIGKVMIVSDFSVIQATEKDFNDS